MCQRVDRLSRLGRVSVTRSATTQDSRDSQIRGGTTGAEYARCMDDLAPLIWSDGALRETLEMLASPPEAQLAYLNG